MTLTKQHEMNAAANYAKLEALRDGINALAAYLESPKFQGDGDQWVSTADVMLRLREMSHAEYEAGEAAAHDYVTCAKCGCNEVRHSSFREYGQTKHYCAGTACRGGCDGFVAINAAATVAA